MDRIKPAPLSDRKDSRRWTHRLKDFAVTVCLWGYFTVGYIVIFAPFYLLALCFPGHRRQSYQFLNSLFYKGFFFLCRWIIPRHKWDIDPAVRHMRSAVIACNHLSYLDSILLVSLYSRHTTIAKDRLFAIPLFGTILKLSGYIPSSGSGRYAELLMNSLESISASLAQGGNVIIFPEGTRSRDGRVGTLQKGGFKIARYCNAPIKVVRVRNTDKLFTPGRFLFNTCIDNTISVRLVGEIPKDPPNGHQLTTKELMARVYALLSGEQ